MFDIVFLCFTDLQMLQLISLNDQKVKKKKTTYAYFPSWVARETQNKDTIDFHPQQLQFDQQIELTNHIYKSQSVQCRGDIKSTM